MSCSTFIVEFNRKTWAHKFKDYPGVATIFMLGQALDLQVHVSAPISFRIAVILLLISFTSKDGTFANNRYIQKNVLAESQEHNDLVVEDFHDVYLNLTMKTGFLLKWLSQDCPEVKFVLKVRVFFLLLCPHFSLEFCQQHFLLYIVSHISMLF